MKFLNPELERLEKRIAPDLLGIGGSIGVGVGVGASNGTADNSQGTGPDRTSS